MAYILPACDRGDVDFSLDIVVEDEEIAVGESTAIKLTYGGQGYTVASEEWYTSDAEVATVDENGIVTAVAKGDAAITLKVTFDNGIYILRGCGNITVDEMDGIKDVSADSCNAPAEYYNLSGVRVNGDALTPGIYIKRTGDKVTKIMVK